MAAEPIAGVGKTVFMKTACEQHRGHDAQQCGHHRAEKQMRHTEHAGTEEPHERTNCRKVARAVMQPLGLEPDPMWNGHSGEKLQGDEEESELVAHGGLESDSRHSAFARLTTQG